MSGSADPLTASLDSDVVFEGGLSKLPEYIEQLYSAHGFGGSLTISRLGAGPSMWLECQDNGLLFSFEFDPMRCDQFERDVRSFFMKRGVLPCKDCCVGLDSRTHVVEYFVPAGLDEAVEVTRKALMETCRITPMNGLEFGFRATA